MSEIAPDTNPNRRAVVCTSPLIAVAAAAVIASIIVRDIVTSLRLVAVATLVGGLAYSLARNIILSQRLDLEQRTRRKQVHKLQDAHKADREAMEGEIAELSRRVKDLEKQRLADHITDLVHQDGVIPLPQRRR